MRILLLKDKTIPEKAVTSWQTEFAAFIKPLLDLTPSVVVEEYDFKDYPTEVDLDGTLRPGDTWLKEVGAMVKRKHGPYRFDHIILLIDLPNWKSDDGVRRIWGTNFSYIYGPFHVHYCRFDPKRAANTFGTIHHEMHHSYDALVKTEAGVDVNPLLGVTRYDAEVTHGGKAPWKYMRWKDNADSIKIMAPHMRKAYAVRKARHEEQIKGMKLTIINLAKQVIYLLRQKLNAKDGIQL